MAIGHIIEKISFHIDTSTFHDLMIPKDPQKIILYVEPKSLNITRSQNARALILVPKYFYIWGIDAITIFTELVGGF